MKRALLPAAVILVLVVGWLVLGRSPEIPGAPEAERAPGEIADVQPSLATGALAEETRSTAATEAQTEPSGARAPAQAAVVGRVTQREDGSTVGGAGLRVRFSDGVRATRADDQGRYRLEVDLPARIYSVEAVATERTGGGLAWNREQRELVPGGELVLDVVVTRGATLLARVVDRERRPVGGALVRAWCRETVDFELPPDRTVTAGADGGFAVPHLGDAFYLIAEAPGLVCAEGLRGKLAAGATVDGLEVVVAPSFSIAGRVVDASSEAPVADARITYDQTGTSSSELATAVSGISRFWPEKLATASAGDGSFTLGPLSARTHASLRIEHASYPMLDWSGRVDGPVLVRLDPGHVVRGRVFDSRGRPAAGAEVRVRGGLGNARKTATGADGRFEVRGLAATKEALVQVHFAGAAIECRQPVEIGPDQLHEHAIELVPGRVLAGRVVDERGAPATGAKVRIEGDRTVVLGADFGEKPTWEMAFGREEAVTDGEGRFRYEDLYEGSFEVAVAHPGAGHLSTKVVARSGDENALVRLDRTAAEKVVLSGRIVDALTGAPIVRSEVIVMTSTPDGSMRGASQVVEDPEGRFRLAGYEPGRIDLLARAEGYAQGAIRGRAFETGVHELEVRCAPVRGLEIRIVDATGAPLRAPANVRFRDADGGELWVESGQGGFASSAWTGDGSLKVAGLPAGVVTVELAPAGGSHHRAAFEKKEQRVDLSAPGVHQETITVSVPPKPVVHTLALAFFETLAEGETELVEPRSAVSVLLRDAGGRTLAEGRLEPRETGQWQVETRTGDTGSRGEWDRPILTIDVPAEVVEAAVEATGYEPRVVDLRGPREPGPVTVFLRPVP